MIGRFIGIGITTVTILVTGHVPAVITVVPAVAASANSKPLESLQLRPAITSPEAVPKTGIKSRAVRRQKRNSRRARQRIRRTWPKQVITRARARCARLLKGLDVIVQPLAPIRRNACGNAAPVKLVAIGSSPRVTLSPAPIVNCDMVVAMHKWLQRDLQPLARKFLKAPLHRIGIMSSYSCRAAYGKRGNRLSQHAHANALDIRSFETSRGDLTALLAHWGPRRRLRRAASPLIVRRAHWTKSTRLATVGWTTVIHTGVTGTKIGQHRGSAAPETDGEGQTSFLKSLFTFRPAGAGTAENSPSSVFAAMSNLGGTKPGAVVRAQRRAFLHAAHQRACTIFGTVLGPDANYTHRHHFHVDLQKRKLGPYCR